MKFKVNAGEFKKAIQPAYEIAAKWTRKKSQFPKMIGLQLNNDHLVVRAFSEKTCITITLDKARGITCLKEGEAIVNAQELNDSLLSHPEYMDLIMTHIKNKLRIVASLRPQVFQDCTTYERSIRTPYINLPFTTNIKVDKSAFISGMSRVAFAVGRDKKLWYYKCFVLKARPNQLTYQAGNGGRFVVQIIDGENLSDTKEDVEIIFPIVNIHNVIRILKPLSSTILQIRTAHDRIVIDCDNVTISLLINEIWRWHPLNKVIKHNYTYQISSIVKSWSSAIAALKDAICSNGGANHYAKVTSDLVHGRFILETDCSAKVKMPVEFSLGKFIFDSDKDKGFMPSFWCDSKCLIEMVKKGRKKDVIILKFENQGENRKVSTGSGVAKKAVLIEYPQITNTNDTKEQFFMFFGMSNRR
ncbi:MAG: hypothetical protein ACYSR0_04300 [Planctomycetota bacterium]|jgi:DNA polymerase III sliding clamp (beta) subunit (PCNA family)